jgi:hypothetical protein
MYAQADNNNTISKDQLQVGQYPGFKYYIQFVALMFMQVSMLHIPCLFWSRWLILVFESVWSVLKIEASAQERWQDLKTFRIAPLIVHGYILTPPVRTGFVLQNWYWFSHPATTILGWLIRRQPQRWPGNGVRRLIPTVSKILLGTCSPSCLIAVRLLLKCMCVQFQDTLVEVLEANTGAKSRQGTLVTQRSCSAQIGLVGYST